MSEEESKAIMKKLITVLSTLSETVQALEEKVSQSNYQIEMLSRQVLKMAEKVDQLDADVDKEFGNLGKGSIKFDNELAKIEKKIPEVPDELLDDELKKLLEQEEGADQAKRKEKK